MVRNIFIIGNGFDLAHKLDTKYSDFIKNVIEEEISNPNSYDDLFLQPIEYDNVDRVLESFKLKYLMPPQLKNKFFKIILQNQALRNWCDIEELYFYHLNNIGSQKDFPTVEKLNADFEAIKYHLENYLINEEQNFTQIDIYKALFNNFNTPNTLILNFNYTSSVKKYLGANFQGEIINIHGELNNKDNPIIFGYAASNQKTRELLNKGDEYVTNIKKRCYKDTNNKDRLISFLNKKKNDKIEVSILGHSCGLSDKLILHDIFNDSHVTKIRNFYFQERRNYSVIQNNIDRIMNHDENFEQRFVNFQDSLFIPQASETESNLKVFLEKLEKIKESQKSRTISVGVY